jgi:hypothetical protein
MSHSAKGRGILNLCCIGHVELEIFKSAECPLLLLEKVEFLQKLAQTLLHLRSLVAPTLKFTLLGYPRLSFLIYI